MQLPCPDLEQAIADRHAGNVELIAHPTSAGAAPVIRLHARSGSTEPVSYTHLTLPTSDLVSISVVAVSLTKKKQNNNTSAPSIPSNQ